MAVFIQSHNFKIIKALSYIFVCFNKLDHVEIPADHTPSDIVYMDSMRTYEEGQSGS